MNECSFGSGGVARTRRPSTERTARRSGRKQSVVAPSYPVNLGRSTGRLALFGSGMPGLAGPRAQSEKSISSGGNNEKPTLW